MSKVLFVYFRKQCRTLGERCQRVFNDIGSHFVTQWLFTRLAVSFDCVWAETMIIKQSGFGH